MSLIKYFCKYIRIFFIDKAYKLYMNNNILFQGARGGFTSLYLSTVITGAPRAGENLPAGAGPGGFFWLTLTSAETRPQSKATISPRRASIQSRGRSSWICTITLHTRAQQSCTHAHAFRARSRTHRRVTRTISRNDAIILARARASGRSRLCHPDRAGEKYRRAEGEARKLASDDGK